MTRIVLSIAVLVALLTGCGGSPTATTGDNEATDNSATQVYDQMNSSSGQERDDALVKMAKEEGELSLYTSNVSLKSFVDAFTAKYSIPVKVYQATSESILQRVTQESKANHQGADIVETNGTELTVLGRDGALYPYRSALRDKVRPEGQLDDWTATRFNMFVVAWNTAKVHDGQQPTSIEALADPSWKGRVSLEVADTDWYATLYEYFLDQGRPQADVDKLFSDVAANAKVVNGHTTQVQLLGAGQFDVAASAYSHNVETAADDGAPITWHPSSGKPVQPVVLRPNGAGLVANAAHPAAAVLFMDFLLSQQGQQIIADSHQLGSVLTDHDPLEGVETVTVDVPRYLDQAKEWNDRYTQLVQGASN
jgi:iron(III) transport system substrate-binding protein